MASDLEGSLVDGGLTPAAAKIISNAIANLATGRTSIGRQVEDNTPASMRLVGRDARKYLLTGLDNPKANPLRAQAKNPAYLPPSKKHPYQDSQPSTGTPTVDTQAVKAGKYLSVGAATTGDVAQSEVSLNIRSLGGTHARLNAATGIVESVPIRIECDQKDKLEGVVEERSDATVIRLRFLK